MRYLVLAVLGLIMFSACSSSGGDAATYDDATALHVALRNAGIDCTGLAVDDDPDIYADTEAKCSFDGEQVDLWTFKDSGAKRNFLGLGETFVCAFGLEVIAWVEDDRWVIWPESETTARAISDAFGGDVRTRECDVDDDDAPRPLEPFPTIPLIPTIDADS